MNRSAVAPAFFCLALWLLSGCRPSNEITMPNPPIDWQALTFVCRHEKDLLPQPDHEADAWYQEANALYKLGTAKERPADLAESAGLLKKAADRGHVKAMNNLVLAYLHGEGVKQSDSEAVAWAERLVQRNIGMGYYHLAVFLEQGIGVKPDRKAALTYFRKAADLGNAQGQLVVGKKIAEAVAQTPDRDAGFQITRMMLQCALDQGLAEAGYELGLHLEVAEKQVAKALAAYQLAARLGNRQSLWALSFLFEGGAPSGIASDPVRSACYRRLASEAERENQPIPSLDRICPLPPKPMPSAP